MWSEPMHPVGQLVMGVLALGLVYQLASALYRGQMTDEDGGVTELDCEPMSFAIMAFFQAMMILGSGWLASGRELASLSCLLGLPWGCR